MNEAWIKDVERQQAQARATAWIEYRELLERSDKPRKDDAARLICLLAQLRLTTADASQHARALAHVRGRARANAYVDEAVERHRVESERVAKALLPLEEQVRQIQAQINQLVTARALTDAEVNRANAAILRFEDVEGQYAELFVPELKLREEHNRRRHLVEFVRDEPQPAGEYDVVNFGQLLEQVAILASSTPLYEFVPIGQQTQEDVDRLTDIARKWRAGEIPQPVYLLEPEAKYPLVKALDCYFMKFDDVMRQIRTARAEPPFHADRVTFIPHPRQSAKRFDEMVRKVHDAYNNHPWVKGTREARAYNASGGGSAAEPAGPRVWLNE